MPCGEKQNYSPHNMRRIVLFGLIGSWHILHKLYSTLL